MASADPSRPRFHRRSSRAFMVEFCASTFGSCASIVWRTPFSNNTLHAPLVWELSICSIISFLDDIALHTHKEMSDSGDFGPAPPGMDLSQSQASSMYGSIITTAVAGTFAVIARFYARLLLRNPIGSVSHIIEYRE